MHLYVCVLMQRQCRLRLDFGMICDIYQPNLWFIHLFFCTRSNTPTTRHDKFNKKGTIVLWLFEAQLYLN